MKLDFVPGPVFENPLRCAADVDALVVPEDMAAAVPYVPAIISRLRTALDGRVPLIGFGGAPFTLACYMVEGQGSKDFARLKQMMYADFPLYDALMKKVTEMDRRYLRYADSGRGARRSRSLIPGAACWPRMITNATSCPMCRS